MYMEYWKCWMDWPYLFNRVFRVLLPAPIKPELITWPTCFFGIVKSFDMLQAILWMGFSNSARFEIAVKSRTAISWTSYGKKTRHIKVLIYFFFFHFPCSSTTWWTPYQGSAVSVSDRWIFKPKLHVGQVSPSFASAVVRQWTTGKSVSNHQAEVKFKFFPATFLCYLFPCHFLYTFLRSNASTLISPGPGPGPAGCQCWPGQKMLKLCIQ